MKLDLLSGKPDLSLLDQIPWMELDHAYGSAIDVPGQIESLLSPDEDVRRGARFGFTSNLFHQGSVYPATVAAIPVFQYLLRYEQVPDRSQILELLADFAVGGAVDTYESIDLPEWIDRFQEQSSSEHLAAHRECYLAVAAGVPLYESLLSDADPRVAISAAMTLAFFPAHAFATCPALLAIGGDAGRHAYERSSALIALSYLRGGAVRDAFLETLRQLLQFDEVNDDRQVSFLAATAAYCLAREKASAVGRKLHAVAKKIAARCIERGIVAPVCDFYRTKKAEKTGDEATIDARELLMPGPRFPWGDLGARIRKHVKDRSPIDVDQRVAAIMRKGAPDPDSFEVQPNAFDRQNVIAAARRLHAYFRVQERSVPIKEFEPFKPHAMLAWDEILRLLDSDVQEDRWAAASVIEWCFGPLPESAIDQLIERLHRGDNSNLGRLLLNQPVSHRQCEELCQRLCRREYEVSQYHSRRDDYCNIVLKHGTSDQLRRLLAECEFAERFRAAQALCSRGECDLDVALPIFAEGLLSADYGIAITAKMTFARWDAAHRWFLEAYETIPEAQRWAISEALSSFKADLTERQEEFLTRIETEKNQVLAAKLVRVLAHLPSPQEATIERLAGLFRSSSSALVRGAIAGTLGRWIGKQADRDGVLIAHLQVILADPAARVRQAAVDALSHCGDPYPHTIAMLRQLLGDEDTDLRRHAMWLLRFREALMVEDVNRLVSLTQPDRVAAETLLAALANKGLLSAMHRVEMEHLAENRPLTRSVWGWISSTQRG